MQHGFDKHQKNANQMSWVVCNHQSWEIRVVCPALAKKGHRVRSICQSWIWTTRMLIICYRMEELVILHKGNFSILGEWVREFAQRTCCSNWVGDQTLWSQLFLKTNYTGGIQAGVLPRNRNGASSCWITCSIMWPLCTGKSVKGAPKDQNWRWPGWPLNTPPCGPF